MISLAQAILHAYPSARPTIDFIVCDDGTGQKITYWNAAVLGAQPSASQIATATTAAQAAKDAAAADDAGDATEKTWLQNNVADLRNGVGTNAERIARLERFSAQLFKRIRKAGLL